MRGSFFFFGLFLWHLTAATQGLSANPSEAPPLFGTIVNGTKADLAVTVPVKELITAEYDWTGPYAGSHVGYAWGSSDWTAHGIGATGPSLTGSLDLYKGFDFSKGTGSFFGGLQAGYNYMLPSQ